MAKFILKTSFLIISTLLFINLIFYVSLTVLPETNYQDANYTWLAKLSKSPKLLLMGSSTMVYALSPGVISEQSNLEKDEIVNLAMNARTPIQSYFLYKNFESYFDSVKIVVYGFDPWIFSKKYYTFDLRVQVLWNLKERWYAFRKFNPRCAILGGEMYTIIKSVHNLFFKPAYTLLDIPEDNVAKVLKQIPKNFSQPVSEWFIYDYFSMSDLQIKYIAKLQQAVEQSGAQFVLFLPPKKTEWLDDYRSTCSHIDEDLISRCNVHLGDSNIIGSFNSMPEPLQSKFLNDGVHLNENGQNYVSKQFANILQKMKSIKKEPLRASYEY